MCVGGSLKQLTLAFDLELGQGSEEVDGVASLVGVADELSVELLVAGQADTAGLLVISLSNEESLVKLLSFILKPIVASLSRFDCFKTITSYNWSPNSKPKRY